MFGNRLGWSISLLIVVFVAALLYFIGSEAGRMTPPGPVGRNAASYVVRMPIEPRAVLPLGNGAQEASPLYLAAIAAFEANRDRLDGPLPNLAADDWKPVLDPLLKAAQSEQIGVFASKPELVIRYENDRTPLASLRAIGKGVIGLALMRHKAGDSSAAREYAQAVFALGARLYYERLTYAEFAAGQEMLGSAVSVLIKVAEATGDRERVDALKDFNAKRIAYVQSSIAPVRQAITLLDPNVGDLAALAEEAPDLMWRIEAVLAMGRCRYSSARAADQHAAREYAAAMMQKSEVPQIHLAAKAATELTVEEFRKLK